MIQLIKPCTIGIVVDDFTFNWLEKPIEKLTGDGHHVFCCINGIECTEAHIGSGVTIQPIDKYRDGKSSVLMAEPLFLTDKQRSIVLKRWNDDIGKKYDKLNLLATKIRLFRRFIKDERRICSEHLAYGYNGFYNFNNKFYKHVTPNDILKDVVYGNSFKTYWLHSNN